MRASPRRARPGSPPAPRTVDRVLDVAERLAQTRGFQGFSYADVAAEVGITTASLHYHFAGKAALGRALVERYAERFGAALEALKRRASDARTRLEGHARLFSDVLARGRMCLCGMLAAEYQTLPPPLQRAIRAYFDANEAWLEDVFERGRAVGELTFRGSAVDAARQWTATLEGAMLLARPYGDAARLTTAARRLLEELTPKANVPAALKRPK